MEKPGIAKDIMDSLPYGMIDGTLLTIEAISGFEKFNNRPYHCYETWCRGWRITDPRLPHSVEREHFDAAVKAWKSLLEAQALSDQEEK
jgi:hypothetical protein